MKFTLKTMAKLNEIREHPAKIYIQSTDTDKEFYLDVSEYLDWKDFEIIDWCYVNGEAEYGDDVIKVWL